MDINVKMTSDKKIEINMNKRASKSVFGVLLKLEFLQDWASTLIARLNPAIMHNLAKYYALKKVHYLSAIEDIEGDYLEFGVFTGSSFCHSIRCFKKLCKINTNITNTKFYGFDSFSGFSCLDEKDKHPFYINQNFVTSFSKVERRVKRVAGRVAFKLVPGFFEESLKDGIYNMGIKKNRIVFIDSDTFTSASQALTFCAPAVQIGTFIVLDDYFSYRGREDRGVAGAFSEFISRYQIKVRNVFFYGMGGAVFVVSRIQK